MQLKQFISKKSSLDGLEKLKDQSMVFCFFSPKLANQPEYWQKVKSIIGDRILVGCTGSGEVGKDLIYDDCAVFTGIKFDKSKVEIQHEKISSGHSFQTGT